MSYLDLCKLQELEVPETVLPTLANTAALKVMNLPFAHGHGPPSHPPGVSGGGVLQQRRGQMEARNIQLQTLQAFNDRRCVLPFIMPLLHIRILWLLLSINKEFIMKGANPLAVVKQNRVKRER